MCSAVVRRDLERAAHLLLSVALGHPDRVLILLFGDSILLKLGVAIGGCHVDDFAQKSGGDHVSDLGSLTPVDMKARIITPHASRKVEKARYSWIVAHRAALFPLVLAFVVILCAVRDLVEREWRFQTEGHRSSGRHQQAPKYEWCDGHG